MPLRKLNPLFCLAGLTLLVTAGCGGSGDSNPPTYPVSGVVTYQGAPVEGATVAFSTITEPIQSSSGVTDSEGRYQLSTFNADDGAQPGNYKIRVFKYERSEAPASPASEAEYVPPAENEVPRQPKNLLPDTYFNIARTPLEFTVTESDSPQTYDIELK